MCLLCTDTPTPPWKLILDSLCSFSSPSFCFLIHQLNFISFLLFCFMVTNSKYCFISLKKCIFSVTFIFIFKKNIPFMTGREGGRERKRGKRDLGLEDNLWGVGSLLPLCESQGWNSDKQSISLVLH